MTDKPNNTHKRGFASMDPERQREIARKGGASVPASKRSFSRDPELAKEAGKRGGGGSTQTVYKSYPGACGAAVRRGLSREDITDLGDSGWLVPLYKNA